MNGREAIQQMPVDIAEKAILEVCAQRRPHALSLVHKEPLQ